MSAMSDSVTTCGSGRMTCNRYRTLRCKASQRSTLSFNCCFSFAELKSLVTFPAFECYPSGLNNDDTSRILGNPAGSLIFINNCKFVFLYILC